MKGKQSLNELEKKMINSVASSLFNDRNIKYHFLFARCNVLLRFFYLTSKQKTLKDNKDDYDGSSILFYSGNEKRPCSALAFIDSITQLEEIYDIHLIFIDEKEREKKKVLSRRYD